MPDAVAARGRAVVAVQRVASRLRPGDGAIVAGLALLGCILLLTAAAPLLTHVNPLETDAGAVRLAPLAPGHLLGTDALGRDILARVLYGGRVSLLVGTLAVVVATVIGVGLGAFAALSPPWLDAVLMRVVDAALTVPQILLVVALQAITRPSLSNVVVVIGLTTWMPMARIVHADIQRLRSREFVQAAETLGTTGPRLLWRHLLPNALGPIVVLATVLVGQAVLIEATLSFLGLGVPPSHPSWGNMLTDAQGQVLDGIWWPLAGAGVALVMTMAAISLCGDGLRRRLAV